MAGDLILDAGPMVTLLDRSEDRHEDCARVLRDHRGPVLTTEPVLRGAVGLVPADVALVRRAARLMEKYQDVPMDYADATLVVLVEDLETDAMFTLDRRGFAVYRWKGRRAFRVVP